jgi:hypothetical protein
MSDLDANIRKTFDCCDYYHVIHGLRNVGDAFRNFIERVRNVRDPLNVVVTDAPGLADVATAVFRGQASVHVVSRGVDGADEGELRDALTRCRGSRQHYQSLIGAFTVRPGDRMDEDSLAALMINSSGYSFFDYSNAGPATPFRVDCLYWPSPSDRPVDTWRHPDGSVVNVNYKFGHAWKHGAFVDLRGRVEGTEERVLIVPDHLRPTTEDYMRRAEEFHRTGVWPKS